jgi:hypothetical protein
MRDQLLPPGCISHKLHSMYLKLLFSKSQHMTQIKTLKVKLENVKINELFELEKYT